MSNPTARTQDSRSTRQLLDELDALMEKMLILPVEDPPAPRPSEPRASEPQPIEPTPPTVAATLTLVDAGDRSSAAFEVGADEEVAENDLLEPTEDDVEETPPITRWRPLTSRLHIEVEDDTENEIEDEQDDESADEEDVDEQIVEDEPVVGYTLAGLAEEQEADEHAESPFHAQAERPSPVNDRNAVYEAGLKWELGFRRATSSFGGLGWALNTPGGRMALGLLGLAMWVAAAVWLARDWMQWPR